MHEAVRGEQEGLAGLSEGYCSTFWEGVRVASPLLRGRLGLSKYGVWNARSWSIMMRP